MKIDGHIVEVGTELYCLAYGFGQVERIDGDVLTMLFSTGKRYKYKDGTNVSFFDRTLYKSPPFILTREGDDQAWFDMTVAIKACLQAIRSVRHTMEH